MLWQVEVMHWQHSKFFLKVTISIKGQCIRTCNRINIQVLLVHWGYPPYPQCTNMTQKVIISNNNSLNQSTVTRKLFHCAWSTWMTVEPSSVSHLPSHTIQHVQKRKSVEDIDFANVLYHSNESISHLT